MEKFSINKWLFFEKKWCVLDIFALKTIITTINPNTTLRRPRVGKFSFGKGAGALVSDQEALEHGLYCVAFLIKSLLQYFTSPRFIMEQVKNCQDHQEKTLLQNGDRN